MELQSESGSACSYRRVTAAFWPQPWPRILRWFTRLVEGLRPDNSFAQAPYLAGPFSLSTPSGMAALYSEVTRQAAMVAYKRAGRGHRNRAADD
jgi:hypothetical protein